MYPVYKASVLLAYEKKLADRALSPRLTEPSPGSLRDECAAVCLERFNRQDEVVLRAYFGSRDSKEDYIRAIERFDISKFKPLWKYIKRLTADPDMKHVELLAWLIDFQDRPYELGKRYVTDVVPGSTNMITMSAEDYSDVAVVENPQPVERKNASDENTKVEANDSDVGGIIETAPVLMEAGNALHILPRWRYWNAFVAGLLLLVAGGAGVWSWDRRDRVMGTTGNGGCMYWADDHYQPIACNQKMANKLLVALDTVLVKNFRKITLPDTITYRAKGWVWYSKINNKVEFFTKDGKHPVMIDRSLKPITDYMIDKYIKGGMTSNP